MAQSTPTTVDSDLRGVVRRTCVTCHNDRTLRGNLSLEHFDVTAAADDAEVAEKMIRKLRAGMMPPPGVQRPDNAVLLRLVETLENNVDAAAANDPNPGGRNFQRLNRPEYERAIRDLLALDVDASDWLPLDQMSANFDNMAEAQTLSPTLLEAYLNAAAAVSRMAVGDQDAPSLDVTYSNNDYVSQHPWDHVAGAPYGTRGGMAVDHVFPTDGEYVFEMTFASGANTRIEDVDVSIDGERVALLSYNTDRRGGADGRGGAPMRTRSLPVRAGQHDVAAAFVRRTDGPYEDLIRPHDWSFAGGGSGGAGITTLPHLRDLIIRGPYNATGLSNTSTRERIFSCRPTTPDDARPCARTIIARLGSEAYRRELTPEEVDGLMPFYEDGVTKGGFEVGVRTALEALLASPRFVFRLEREPVDIPDDELITLAAAGRLSEPATLDRQVRRMLDDPRANALVANFAGQWLGLRNVSAVQPDEDAFPDFGEGLRQAFRRETELLFESVLREDRSVLDLLAADYTFVNERLARHYGIPNVRGSHFRRVMLDTDKRGGLLGHGSILTVTSYANRTSPVLRGKWVLENILGTPPPPPPADVPPLEATIEGQALSMREAMEQHRANPVCASCHRVMDPPGLSLEHYDAIGRWRDTDGNGDEIDASGVLPDGSEFDGPAGLREALLRHPDRFVTTVTEKLLTYALGRGVEYYDAPAVRAIIREAAAHDHKLTSVIIGVVKSVPFQMRRTPS